MLLKEYNQGNVIFREGDRSSAMYRIIEGGVKVQISMKDGKNVVLTTLGPDKIFGEMAMLDAWPRSATIVVTENGTKLLEIEREEINEFFRKDPRQVEVLMTNLSRRIRGLTEDYLEACDTLREMGKTVNDKKRSEGLLGKISRFISVYSKTVRYLTTLDETNDLLAAEQVEQNDDKSSVYRKNTVIFRQDDAGDCMYYVQLGSVGIFTDYGTAWEKMLTRLETETFFGEMGLIERLPRSATAVALDDDTVLRKITKEELDSLYEVSPALAIRCLKHMSSRLRALTKDYLAACEMIARTDAAERDGSQLTYDEEERKKVLIEMAGRRRVF